MIIIGGGDGILNLVIDVLVKIGLFLGILLLGIVNDLVRILGIFIFLFEVCWVIVIGKKCYIDLGLVNGKYFFNVVSIGLSVDIINYLMKEVKFWWGVLVYVIVVIKMIL